jgi:hypothetical protein
MWRAAVKAYPRTTAADAVSALVTDVGFVDRAVHLGTIWMCIASRFA